MKSAVHSLVKPQMCTHQEGQQGSFTLDYFVVIGNDNAKEMAGVHFRKEEKKGKSRKYQEIWKENRGN